MKRDVNHGKTQDYIAIGFFLFIAMLLLIALNSCSHVNKHKSSSSYQIDTTGSTYINNVVVNKKDSVGETTKTEQAGSLKTIETNSGTTIKFLPFLVSDSAWKGFTTIEENGVKITTNQPIEKIDTKHKSKAVDKDSSSKSVTTKSTIGSTDSSNQQAGQTTAKKASGEAKTKYVDKGGFSWSFLWWLIPLLAIVAAWKFRNPLIDWGRNRKV